MTERDPKEWKWDSLRKEKRKRIRGKRDNVGDVKTKLCKCECRDE